MYFFLKMFMLETGRRTNLSIGSEKYISFKRKKEFFIIVYDFKHNYKKNSFLDIVYIYIYIHNLMYYVLLKIIKQQKNIDFFFLLINIDLILTLFLLPVHHIKTRFPNAIRSYVAHQ